MSNEAAKVGCLKKWKLYLEVLLIIALCLPYCIAWSEEEPAIVQAQYLQLGTGKAITISTEMRDEWFNSPSNVYSKDLARLSMLLTTSAFRRSDCQDQDRSVRQFLTDAGFSDLRSDDYAYAPTSESVATMMGYKQIDNTVLLAVGVCGAGYKDEWISNLTVGSGIRHEGFAKSAAKVENRIREYLDEHHFEAPVKLWISGFSRAAAVSNITAADMTDSGLFADVFAYTFATPRTTKEPGHYENIFNIVGKNDAIPMVPLQDWGYKRFGIDLFTPSQEADSDYIEDMIAADLVSSQLDYSFRNNPEVNQQLHTIIEYLLALMPEDIDYEQNMQPIAISLWNDKSTDRILESLVMVLEEMEVKPENKQVLSDMIDYIMSVLNTYAQGNVDAVRDGSWDADASLSVNLFLEHNPDTYVAWVLSDLPLEKLLPGTDRWTHLVVSGPVDVTVYKEGRPYCKISQNGQRFNVPINAESSRPDLTPAEYSLLPMIRNENQTILTVPRDKDYIVEILTEKDEDITYTLAQYSLHSIKPMVGSQQTVRTTAGNPCLMYLDDQDDENRLLYDHDGHAFNTLQVLESKYSPSLINRLEKLNVFYLTLPELVGVAFVALAFVTLVLIIIIITTIIRLIRHKRRNPGATIACHAFVLLVMFFWQDFARESLGAFSMIQVACRAIIGLTLVLLALKGCLRTRKKQHWLILLAVALSCAGNALIVISALGGYILLLAAILAVIAAYILGTQEKIKAWQWLVFGICWIVLVAVTVYTQPEAKGKMVLLIGYIGALSAMIAFSLRLHPLNIVAAALLSVSTLFTATVLPAKQIGEIYPLIPLSYYAAMIVLASTAWLGAKGIKN